MIHIKNRKNLEEKIEEVRNFAHAYLEKYSSSKQQLRTYLLNCNIKKSFNRLKNKIPLPKEDLKLFTIDRGKKLIENFKEAVKHGTAGVHKDICLYSNDWGFKLKNIKKKIFIWHGDKDLTVPIITNKYYKKKLKNKKIFIKINEGHFSICYNFMNDIIQKVSE